MREILKQNDYFVNLHCPYDIAFIRYQNREYNFDRGGRLLWLINEDGKRIERSLNNRFVKKWDIGIDGVFKRNKVLIEKESEKLYNKMLQDLSSLLETINYFTESFFDHSFTKDQEEINNFIKGIISTDYQKARQDALLFKRIYQDIEIIPNDITLPLIIQLTNGCVYNKCTFCGFYKDKSFKIKDIKELKAHIKEIKSFLGESLKNMQHIFLGDANALMIRQDILINMLDIINKEFRIDTQEKVESIFQEETVLNISNKTPYYFVGIYSFIDAFLGLEKGVSDFVELKKRNIKRIYIGMESGSDKILSFVRKCCMTKDIITLTQKIKKAGIPVGIMLIAGLGGTKYYDDHVKGSINILNRLDLDREDNIYFSHLFLHEKATYKEDIKREGIRSLNYEDENRQIQEIIEGLKFIPSHHPTIKGYEVQYVRF